MHGNECQSMVIVHVLMSSSSQSNVSLETVVSPSSAKTAEYQSVSLPHWSTTPFTPRYLTATTFHHQPPPPFNLLIASTAVESGNLSTETGGNEEERHLDHDSNGDSAAIVTTSMVSETSRKDEMDVLHPCSCSGGAGKTTSAENISAPVDDTAMTVSTAMTTSSTRPLVIPSPPTPVVSARSIAPASTRKRKRIPGASRMRNFLCMYPGCGKSFMDSAHLRDHTVVHTGEKKLSCAICQKLFARTSTLQEHLRVHTGKKPYVCSIPGCSKRYSSRAAMRFHRTTHASQLSCTANLEGHIHARNGVNPIQAQSSETSSYVCRTCGKHFCMRELLVAHLKIHATQHAAALTSVAYSGSVETAIDRQESVGDETNAVHWRMDDEKSADNAGIPLSDESKFCWDTIRAQQNQIKQLKAEIMRLRGQTCVDPAIATSVQTEVAVSSQAALTAPVEMLQDGYKPFECCICNNRFANFYQLTFHGKQHPEALMTEVIGTQTPLPVGPKHCPEKQCEYAESTGKSLKNLQTLKRHWQRRHQNERPYGCSYCPATRQKTFKTRENLKAHEKDCTKNVVVQ